MASLALIVLASGSVWCLFFLGKLPQPPVQDPFRERTPFSNYAALGLVLYLIFRSVEGLLAANTGAPITIKVETLQAGVVEKLLILAILFGSMFLTSDFSLEDYGFHTRNLRRQLAVGGLAFLASFLPVFLLLLATMPFRTEETLHPFLQLMKNNPGSEVIFWIGISVVVIAPLWEEFAYRVILQTALENWLPSSIALPLTAVLFCAVHGWPDMIPLLPLALILGWVYHRYQSYLAVVLVHALFNSWMLGWQFMTESPG